MMKSFLIQSLKEITFSLFIILAIPVSLLSQEGNQSNDLERTFMPNVQMGYVLHGTEELSGGLMTQVSMEYRDVSNFVFRINYDDFNTNMNLNYPINENVTFTGKTSFTDLIIGIGYRETIFRNNFTAYIQPGLRFYGYPIFETDGNQVQLDYDSRSIGVIRYSIGYEYTLTPKLFLIAECLVSHTLKSKDFWADNPWAYGVTLGLSTPLQ